MDALTVVTTDEQTEYRGIVSDVRAADLPNEVSNSFSSAPYEFEQTSSVLWDDTQQIYYHACIANRFSEHYLVLCGQLEKNIKQLGSFCVTKAALEQKGMLFPKLEKMNVRELVCMVSYHFRKAHAALQGIYRDNDLLGITYLNWEFRWVGLGNRLKSTEVKIRMIKEGRYMPKAVLEQNEAFKGEPRTNGEDALSTPQALRANASALPVKGAMARTMLAAEKAAENERKAQDRLLRDADKTCTWDLLRTRVQHAEASGQGGQKPQKPVQKEGTISEAEARRELIRYATEHGDQKALTEIPMEDSKTFLKRWNDHIENHPAEPGSIAPAEVRKILIKDAEQRNDMAAVLAIPTENYDDLHDRWTEYLSRTGGNSAGRADDGTGQPSKGTVLQSNSRSPGGGPSAETRKALRGKRKKKR